MLAEVGRNLPPEGPHQNQDFQSSVRPAKLFLSPSHLYAAAGTHRLEQFHTHPKVG
ncbi:unnamed protein product [Musa banksii]